MILYTIMPMEVIFENNTDDDVQYKEIDYLGQRVQVVQYENKLLLNRLYSTDPKQYLNPNFKLGKIIKK